MRKSWLERLRLSSIEVNHLSDDLVAALPVGDGDVLGHRMAGIDINQRAADGIGGERIVRRRLDQHVRLGQRAAHNGQRRDHRDIACRNVQLARTDRADPAIGVLPIARYPAVEIVLGARDRRQAVSRPARSNAGSATWAGVGRRPASSSLRKARINLAMSSGVISFV